MTGDKIKMLFPSLRYVILRSCKGISAGTRCGRSLGAQLIYVNEVGTRKIEGKRPIRKAVGPKVQTRIEDGRNIRNKEYDK